MQQKSKFPFIQIISIIVIIFSGAYVLLEKYQNAPIDVGSQDQVKNVDDATSKPTAPTPEVKTPVVTNGSIGGALGYPSEVIPEDIKVCALNIETTKETCTSEHIKDAKFSTGTGYLVSVTPGDYYVYAEHAGMTDNKGDVYKAYYSEFVTCGLNANCTSHEPIKVTVASGQNIEKIDPQDWYK